MYIQKFRLLNYKSYIDSQSIQFSPGINIIIGQNNSGKTALLETLTLKLESRPHRSLQTLRFPYSKLDEESSARVKLVLEKDELKHFLEQLPPPLGVLDRDCDDYPVDCPEMARDHIKSFQKLLDNPQPVEINFSLSSESPLNVKWGTLTAMDWEAWRSSLRNKHQQAGTIGMHRGWSESLSSSQKANFITFELSANGSISPCIVSELKYDGEIGFDIEEEVDWKSFEGGIEQWIPYKIFNLFRDRIYRFYAERLNIGSFPYTGNSELKPDASNLAEVLYWLSIRNPAKFDRLKKAFLEIFSQLGTISFREHRDSQVEVRIWTKEATEHEREDLSLSLSDCGTGISQVLAILYVALTSEFSRTIIIDEPQAFLHPGAAKKLIEIIKTFSQHQYIISTHSPMIIGAATPCQIIQLICENSATTASVIRAEETDKQRAILADVGVRLSDVFGADNILWVEGETEELCFPVIWEKVAEKSLMGTVILAVDTTGDLVETKDKKRAATIFHIYKRLSSSGSLLPPAIGFIFDSEGKNEAEKTELKKRSDEPICFLKRRMYENYLLVPKAIAFVLTQILADIDGKWRDSPFTEAEVEAWIAENGLKEDYIKGSQALNVFDNTWLKEVHAAKILKNLFYDLSENKINFSKTRESYLLTQWIAENSPDSFQDIVELLNEVLNR